MAPGGVNRKNRVHSTLPMPSSAETWTQQAVSVCVCVYGGWEGASLLTSVALYCHIFNERPAGGALCQRYYLVLWQLVCLEKEAIKMSLTENSSPEAGGMLGEGAGEMGWEKGSSGEGTAGKRGGALLKISIHSPQTHLPLKIHPPTPKQQPASIFLPSIYLSYPPKSFSLSYL